MSVYNKIVSSLVLLICLLGVSSYFLSAVDSELPKGEGFYGKIPAHKGKSIALKTPSSRTGAAAPQMTTMQKMRDTKQPAHVAKRNVEFTHTPSQQQYAVRRERTNHTYDANVAYAAHGTVSRTSSTQGHVAAGVYQGSTEARQTVATQAGMNNARRELASAPVEPFAAAGRELADLAVTRALPPTNPEPGNPGPVGSPWVLLLAAAAYGWRKYRMSK